MTSPPRDVGATALSGGIPSGWSLGRNSDEVLVVTRLVTRLVTRVTRLVTRGASRGGERVRVVFKP